MNFSAKNRTSYLSRLQSFDATVVKERPQPQVEPARPTEVHKAAAPSKEYVPRFELYRGVLYLDDVFYTACTGPGMARLEIERWERTHFFSTKPATLHINE